MIAKRCKADEQSERRPWRNAKRDGSPLLAEAVQERVASRKTAQTKGTTSLSSGGGKTAQSQQVPYAAEREARRRA